MLRTQFSQTLVFCSLNSRFCRSLLSAIQRSISCRSSRALLSGGRISSLRKLCPSIGLLIFRKRMTWNIRYTVQDTGILANRLAMLSDIHDITQWVHTYVPKNRADLAPKKAPSSEQDPLQFLVCTRTHVDLI